MGRRRSQLPGRTFVDQHPPPSSIQNGPVAAAIDRRAGWTKIQRTRAQAIRDDLRYVWVDVLHLRMFTRPLSPTKECGFAAVN